MGFFPSANEPRVLWVGMQEQQKLYDLQREIDLLFTPKRSFKPHLTIARCKHVTENDRLELIDQIERLEVKPLQIRVTHFKLYKSTLTRLGPIYESLETFKAKV